MAELRYAQNMEEALKALEEGFEPVECSFGPDSVIGKYKLDHHGKYSGEEAVSVKAAKLALAGERCDRFVVTGAADCDQSYAIAALSGYIPINIDEAMAIAEVDMDQIGKDMTSERYLRILLFDQKTLNLPNCLESTQEALFEFTNIFNGDYSDTDINEAVKNEIERRERVKADIKAIKPGKIALVSTSSRGFDVWYKCAPIVVEFFEPKSTITLGVCPKNGPNGYKSGLDILGSEGLKTIYPILGEGWGGRETIGGSPRDLKMTFQDARRAYRMLKRIL